MKSCHGGTLFFLCVLFSLDRGHAQRALEEDVPHVPLVNEPLADYAPVRLSLSLWDPQATSGDELIRVVSDPKLQEDVVRSLEEVLCSVSDTRIINRAAALFDESLLDEYDVCVQRYGHSRGNRSPQGRQVSVLQSKPEIEIVQVTRFGVLWSLWSVSWTALRVGDLYVSEAIMNNPFVPITDVEGLAVQAMEQVAQLSLNINIMEDEFDELLRTNLPERRLYASVTSEEIETYAASALDYREKFMYSPRMWYPMRIFGLSLLASIIVVVSGLIITATLRRRRLDNQASLDTDETPSVVNLGSAEYVDKLLLHSPSSNVLPVPRPSRSAFSEDHRGGALVLSTTSREDDGVAPSTISSLGVPYGESDRHLASNARQNFKSVPISMSHA